MRSDLTCCCCCYSSSCVITWPSYRVGHKTARFFAVWLPNPAFKHYCLYRPPYPIGRDEFVGTTLHRPSQRSLLLLTRLRKLWTLQRFGGHYTMTRTSPLLSCRSNPHRAGCTSGCTARRSLSFLRLIFLLRHSIKEMSISYKLMSIRAALFFSFTLWMLLHSPPRSSFGRSLGLPYLWRNLVKEGDLVSISPILFSWTLDWNGRENPINYLHASISDKRLQHVRPLVTPSRRLNRSVLSGACAMVMDVFAGLAGTASKTIPWSSHKLTTPMILELVAI